MTRLGSMNVARMRDVVEIASDSRSKTRKFSNNGVSQLIQSTYEVSIPRRPSLWRLSSMTSVFCDDSIHARISFDGTTPSGDLRKELLMLEGSRRILKRQNKTGRVARMMHCGQKVSEG